MRRVTWANRAGFTEEYEVSLIVHGRTLRAWLTRCASHAPANHREACKTTAEPLNTTRQRDSRTAPCAKETDITLSAQKGLDRFLAGGFAPHTHVVPVQSAWRAVSKAGVASDSPRGVRVRSSSGLRGRGLDAHTTLVLQCRDPF